ncbi:hypothetical protein [Pseudooceanicola sp.]|uniref:hypothetical protein n=1 Tax=Pseudooceanicola sp. TaxID=1914328 RepID=UPI004058EC2E
MTHSFRPGRRTTRLSTALSATLAAILPGVAMAEVSPQDVWDQWQSYMSGFGYEMTASPVAEGRNLRIPTFSMTMPMPAAPEADAPAGEITLTMGEIGLIDRGDGSVGIEMPARMPIILSGEGTEEDDFSIKATLTTEGYSTIATGTPEDISYGLSAVRIGMTVDEFTGKKGPVATPGTVAMTMEGAKGTSRLGTVAGSTTIEQSFDLVKLIYTVDITNPQPDKPGHFKASGTIDGLSSTGRGVLPDGFDPANLSAALDAGYLVDGAMRYVSGQGQTEFEDPEQSFKIATSSEGGTFRVAMSSAGLAYDVLSRNLTLNLESSEMPFPVATSMTAFGLGVDVPVSATEEAQPFNASLTLTDLVVPEMIWMMADPTNSLPHDPLTAEVDLSGKGRLFVDLTDEAAMSQLGKTGGNPGEVDSLSIDSFVLKAAGATIDASADFAIDNEAVSVFNPAMPAIAGTADLRLTGVMGLINKLGQMGLIPGPQAMMTAGMIQQLGKIESGPDDVSAKIELSQEGAVTINGNALPLR